MVRRYLAAGNFEAKLDNSAFARVNGKR